MRKVNVKFTRRATVTETGGVSVEVLDITDVDEILSKAHSKKWVEFLTTKREYGDDDEWDFEIIKPTPVVAPAA